MARHIPLQSLTRHPVTGTIEGGTAGPVHAPEEQPLTVSSAEERSALVVALDTAMGALCTMFGCALRPHGRGARERLDDAYETLVTCVEEFRDAVPKA